MRNLLTTTSSFDIEGNGALVDLCDHGYRVIHNPYGRRLTEDEVIGLFRDYQPVGLVAGVEPLSRAALEAASPSLKVVSRCGVGLDSVDLNAAAALDIIVRNTPEAPTLAVAELTIALILNMLRRISATDRDIRRNTWKPQMGNTIANKTVGLIGGGRIGSKVAALVTGLGCNVIVHDPKLSPGGIDYEIVKLDELLSRADILSLHLPLTTDTHNIIDAKALAAMKPGSWLVNTSRGGLVDESALFDALEGGRLTGAALDVFAEEPYRGSLTRLDNVVLTAHMGSYARETRIRMEQEAVENLVDALATLGLVEKA